MENVINGTFRCRLILRNYVYSTQFKDKHIVDAISEAMDTIIPGETKSTVMIELKNSKVNK